MIPEVQAVKDPDNGLAVIDCPYCSKEHRHGWRSGERVAHCQTNTTGTRQYYVKCD